MVYSIPSKAAKTPEFEVEITKINALGAIMLDCIR